MKDANNASRSGNSKLKNASVKQENKRFRSSSVLLCAAELFVSHNCVENVS